MKNTDTSSYGELIQNDEEFRKEILNFKKLMAEDANLRRQSLELQMAGDSYRYTYQQVWCGVPVIRLPDDIVIFQEIIWSTRPSFVIETGIARGGSLVLSASLMQMSQRRPRVLGIDLKILDHTRISLNASPLKQYIELVEADSISQKSLDHVKKFIESERSDSVGILVLDSNHTHDHVFLELTNFAPLMPIGSLILVADTLIEERPQDYVKNRPWGVGNSPLSALNKFLEENKNYTRVDEWGKRGLLSEFRDGIIRKIS